MHNGTITGEQLTSVLKLTSPIQDKDVRVILQGIALCACAIPHGIDVDMLCVAVYRDVQTLVKILHEKGV